MSLKLGNTDINALGNNINKAYLGAIEVFDNVLVSLWQTTTANETITLPTPTNYRVDWGDGTVTTNTNSHEYLVANQYTIKISGYITDFVFNNTGDKEKILGVSKYGGIKIIEDIFYGCFNLNVTATDVPFLSSTVKKGFRGCSSLVYNSSVNNWDLSNTTAIDQLFYENTNFNQPLNNWDVSSVEAISFLFFNCVNFNQPLNNWDVSSVNLSFTQLFAGASNFNQPLPWNVSGVTGMIQVFNRASSFNQDLSWDTTSVTSMSQMFLQATNFDGLLIFNTENVTDFSFMFQQATNFNQPLNFDLSSAVDMSFMFQQANAFNQFLNWDTSNIQKMNSMFRLCPSYNQPLNHWDFSSVNRMDGFMNLKGVEYDANYMDDLYIKLDQDLIFANMVNVNIDFGTIKYTSNGAAARASLVSKGFIITSGPQT